MIFFGALDSRLRGNDRRGTSGMTVEERDCFASLAMTGEAACAGMTEGGVRNNRGGERLLRFARNDRRGSPARE
jgi:hypothetical protein